MGGVVAVVPDERPFCFYCDRDFDNIKTLVAHQQTKHFNCVDCGLKFDTTTNLRVHMLNAHKKKLTAVTGAIEGRDNPDYVIHGMDGVPQHVKDARREAQGLPPASASPFQPQMDMGPPEPMPPAPAPMGMPPPPMGGAFMPPMGGAPPPMPMPPAPAFVPPPSFMPPPMPAAMPNIPEGMKPELPAGLHPAVYLVLGAVPKKIEPNAQNSAMSGVAGLLAGLNPTVQSAFDPKDNKRPGDPYGQENKSQRVMI